MAGVSKANLTDFQMYHIDGIITRKRLDMCGEAKISSNFLIFLKNMEGIDFRLSKFFKKLLLQNAIKWVSDGSQNST